MSAANEPEVMSCPRCGDGQTSLALADAISRTRLQQPFPHFPSHAPRWISSIFSVAPSSSHTLAMCQHILYLRPAAQVQKISPSAPRRRMRSVPLSYDPAIVHSSRSSLARTASSLMPLAVRMASLARRHAAEFACGPILFVTARCWASW